MGLRSARRPICSIRTASNGASPTFSPRALRATRVRAVPRHAARGLRNAGGVRIDHAMGLQRLWLVPEGASPADGAYLRYPLSDLLRLLALESQRHRAIVVGEDLGTVPEGFREATGRSRHLRACGCCGSRKDDDAFLPPKRWDRERDGDDHDPRPADRRRLVDGRRYRLRAEHGVLGKNQKPADAGA